VVCVGAIVCELFSALALVFLRVRSFQRFGRDHSQEWLCYEIAPALHFGGTASKLFLLLTRKGLTLGC
jgi:hypothetical protein